MPLSLRQPAINLYELASGRQIMARLAELNRSQWLTREQLLTLQKEKLHCLLKYADEHIPYYQRVFKQVGFEPDQILASPTSFHKIPLLSKAAIMENFDDMITTEPSRRKRLSRFWTSGSTGHPLSFIHDTSFRDYLTADLHRHIMWTGWTLGECQGYIWGSAFDVPIQKTLRARLIDWAFNRITTSAFALTEESMASFARKIEHTGTRVLLGYSSALVRFAEFAHERGIAGKLALSGILSTAEALHPRQREVIESSLGCKVLDRYATRELGGIACECPEHGALHLSIENVCVEILRDGVPAAVGQEGDIVVTNLNNYGMPFIRYQVGDIGQLSDAACLCGRGSPIMEAVYGRVLDMFKTAAGKSIHGYVFHLIFSDMSEVAQFQVTQKDYDHIAVSIVEREPMSPERLAYIENAIQDTMESKVRVDIQRLEQIPVPSSGKFRYTVSEVM
jgi:phenylacetate-CoA ligase